MWGIAAPREANGVRCLLHQRHGQCWKNLSVTIIDFQFVFSIYETSYRRRNSMYSCRCSTYYNFQFSDESRGLAIFSPQVYDMRPYPNSERDAGNSKIGEAQLDRSQLSDFFVRRPDLLHELCCVVCYKVLAIVSMEGMNSATPWSS